MKHSAVRTLGVAALGAAFAALGAGAAGAATAVPDATPPALDTVTQTLPGENVATAQPGTAGALTRGQDALSRGQDALGAGVAATRPAVENALQGGPTAPLHSRIGGLQAPSLPAQGLPMQGLPTPGLPKGVTLG
ncbi:ATP-binding protein [Streptomyces sp. NPDC002521]